MPATIRTCQVPKEYDTLLRERSFTRETPEVKVSKWRALFSGAVPTPVIFRSPAMDLQFVWERIVEANAGPSGANADQWLPIELLVPLVTGRPIYEKGRPILSHAHYAAALSEHLEKIAAAVAPHQLEITRQLIASAAEERFKGVVIKNEA